jgi:hypothetical protein
MQKRSERAASGWGWPKFRVLHSNASTQYCLGPYKFVKPQATPRVTAILLKLMVAEPANVFWCVIHLLTLSFDKWMIGGIMSQREKRSTGRKVCPSATMSTTNSTWSGLGLYLSLRGERPAINRLNHGTALCQWRNFMLVAGPEDSLPCFKRPVSETFLRAKQI